MNKPPAFQFYPKDFLSDINVVTMTNEQRGVYITLLCHCWLENGIPIDSPLVKDWLQDGSPIRKCFYKKGERLRHKRLDQEKRKQKDWSAKSSLGGQISAKKRWGNPPVEDKGRLTTAKPKCNTSSSSSSSTTETKIYKNKQTRFCSVCLTLLLIDGILNYDDKARVPKIWSPGFLNWVDEIRKMRQLDKRDRGFILGLIRYSQNDDFWRGVILSTANLRKNDTKLLHNSEREIRRIRESGIWTGKHND